MTERTQRILKVSAISLAVLVVVYSIARFAVLNRASDLDQRAKRIRGELTLLERSNSRKDAYSKSLDKLAAETFGLDTLKVSEEIRARIDEMVAASGMRRSKTASTPVTGSGKRGAYDEIGWRYDLEGTLDQAVNMLYLLQSDPYLHHIEGLSITPIGDRHEVKMAFRYMTIVLESVKGETLVTGEDHAPKPIATLGEDSRRKDYELVVARNLFRPYVKRQPTPAPPNRQRPDNPPPAQPPATPDQARFRVASLSRLGDRQEIAIVDVQSNAVREYNPGDKLAGGTIVMVDHRRLPQHKQPELTADSRLVLRIGQDYYAVDISTTLADRYRLRGEDLPEPLQPKPTTAPETTPETTEALLAKPAS